MRQRALTGLAVVFVLAALLVDRSHQRREAAGAEAIARLDELRALSATVDLHATAARLDLFAHYDDLVRALGRLRDDARRLSGEPELSRPMATFVRELDERTREIDELKGAHAAQRNSRRYFLQWLGQTDETADAQLRFALASFLLAPTENEQKEKVDDLLRAARPSGVAAADSTGDHPEQRHLKVLREASPPLDELSRRFIARPLSVVAERASDDYRARLEQRLAPLGHARAAALALALLFATLAFVRGHGRDGAA